MNQPSMSPDAIPDLDDDDHRVSVWRENHGNFLAAFVVCILVIGSGILACRQLQFHPPRFPDSRAFPDPPTRAADQEGDSSPTEPGGGNIDEVNPVDQDLRNVQGAAETKGAGASTLGKNAGQPSKKNSLSSSEGQPKEITNVSEEPIRIVAAGAADSRGAMMFAVYESKETFNQIDRAIVRERRQIRNGIAVWDVEQQQLPKRFAVAVYHDQDGDGKLDRNALGIPTENYGYSNNARALMGPPKFEQAALDRPRPGQAMNITIR